MLYIRLGGTDIKFRVKVTEMFVDGMVTLQRTGKLEPPERNVRVDCMELVTEEGKVLGKKFIDPPIMLGPHFHLEVHWDLRIHAPGVTKAGFETLKRFDGKVKGEHDG